MTLSLSREVEHKFRVPDTLALPPLGEIVPDAQEVGAATLTATYYDTADFRLARAGMTLRRRVGGSDDGWHLKLPVSRFSAGVRDELHVDASPDAGLEKPGSPPAELASIVRAITRHAPLAPVATLVTERATWLLHDASGATAGELVDDRVTGLAAGAGESRFREIELEERPSSTPELIRGVGQALAAAGAEAGEFVPKLARVVGSAALGQPEVPLPPEFGPDTSADEALMGYLARQVKALRMADLGVRRDAPDSVHQMRVAARRIRSCLRAFRPFFDREWSDHVRAELGWMASALGDYRKCEVLLARVAGRASNPTPAEGPGVQLIMRSLEADLARAETRVGETLSRARYVDLHDTLVASFHQSVTKNRARNPAQETLAPGLSVAWNRLARRVAELLAAERVVPAGAPDSAWHATRLAAKRARYAVDATTSVFGADADALASHLSHVTDLLGDHQDASEAAQLAGRLADSAADPRTIFALGIIHRDERDQVTKARTEFADLWPEVAQAVPERWLAK